MSNNDSNNNFDALWPVLKPYGVIFVTGPVGVGKTTFCITTGARPDRTVFLDGEQSAKIYNDVLHFRVYHDLVAESGLFADDAEYYKYTLDIVKSLPDDNDVLVFDNIARFESGMMQYIEQFPEQFGLTRYQIQRATGFRDEPPGQCIRK